jgi:hypothetical protein
MLVQGQVINNVPSTRASGSPNALQLQLGELGVSEVLPRFTALNWSGLVFSYSVSSAAAITAYTGGAAGQPQIAIFNPPGSGKNFVLLGANYGNVVAASAAGTVSWGLWFGQTALTSVAQTVFATNNLNLNSTGSAAKVYANTALTGSTALTNVLPLGSYYWATAAGAALVTQASPIELPGAIIIPPGSMAALGGSAALTSATWIGNLTWAELPV